MSFSDLDDFLQRARDRLDPVDGPARLPEVGDLDMVPAGRMGAIRPAGVMMGVIPRRSGATALFTLRPLTMAAHPGQVAFPGGKVDPGDADEVAAAVREAHEEVGIDPARVELLARGAPYVTGSAFRVVPVIALLPGDFEPRPCPNEVAGVFEAPLDFLMNPANHRACEGQWQGLLRRYYEMPHGGHRIWGVTAGIIRQIYLQLYEAVPMADKAS